MPRRLFAKGEWPKHSCAWRRSHLPSHLTIASAGALQPSDSRADGKTGRTFTYGPPRLPAIRAFATAPATYAFEWAIDRKPANQPRSELRDSDAYPWTGQANANTVNGLNRYRAWE
jgi:hypothetical protein